MASNINIAGFGFVMFWLNNCVSFDLKTIFAVCTFPKFVIFCLNPSYLFEQFFQKRRRYQIEKLVWKTIALKIFFVYIFIFLKVRYVESS